MQYKLIITYYNGLQKTRFYKTLISAQLSKKNIEYRSRRVLSTVEIKYI